VAPSNMDSTNRKRDLEFVLFFLTVSEASCDVGSDLSLTFRWLFTLDLQIVVFNKLLPFTYLGTRLWHLHFSKTCGTLMETKAKLTSVGLGSYVYQTGCSHVVASTR
jgi:hypothetical protein